ncbi:hypothetical protein BGX31_006312 [Mortierella sp. GBA43]|nr:hypothetical protein BGX31_006312 [Mortierella sp. GBA43]
MSGPGTSFSNMRQQYGDNENDHPLSSNHYDNSSRYPDGSPYQTNIQGSKTEYIHNNNEPVGFHHNVSPQQQEQLDLQKQHQQRLQEQIQAQDTIRMQQHRVARPNAATAVQDHSNTDSKPANYYAYPPQPNASSTSDQNQKQGLSVKERLTKLVKFPCSIYGKSLLLVFSLEAMLVIIMQIIIVLKYRESLADISPQLEPGEPVEEPLVDSNNPSRPIVAYLIVFVFAQLFQIVMAWDAVRAQNTIQMIAFVVFNLCCFAYSSFEITQTRSTFDQSTRFLRISPAELMTALMPLLIVVVVVIGVTQCIITWLSYQLFQEFGWKIYKKIGADPNTKRMYRAYQIYLVLIKVDLFFFVGFSIQFVYLTLNDKDYLEYWLTIIVTLLTPMILYIAFYAVRHESRKWMSIFIMAMLCGVAYFLFKVVRMYYGEKSNNYIGTRRFLTLFGKREGMS